MLKGNEFPTRTGDEVALDRDNNEFYVLDEGVAGFSLASVNLDNGRRYIISGVDEQGNLIGEGPQLGVPVPSFAGSDRLVPNPLTGLTLVNNGLKKAYVGSLRDGLITEIDLEGQNIGNRRIFFDRGQSSIFILDVFQNQLMVGIPDNFSLVDDILFSVDFATGNLSAFSTQQNNTAKIS